MLYLFLYGIGYIVMWSVALSALLIFYGAVFIGAFAFTVILLTWEILKALWKCRSARTRQSIRQTWNSFLASLKSSVPKRFTK